MRKREPITWYTKITDVFMEGFCMGFSMYMFCFWFFTWTRMEIIILILPLLNFLILGFFSIFLNKKNLLVFSLVLIFSLPFLIFIIFIHFMNIEFFLNNQHTNIFLFNWLLFDFLKIPFGLLFDSLTIIMLFIITFIAALVYWYSIEYMRMDLNLFKFLSYLSLFTFFMILLVTANNFLQMFFGWEGVGLASYLLINFWFNKIQANKAAMKALIVNKIGDVGLLFGMLILFFYFKSLNYNFIFLLIPDFINKNIYFLNYNLNIISIICFFLFIGAIGKSAQIGLHTWLPDAMEGPTPVSALIHAATMVTAGIFLIIRTSFIFEYAPKILIIILFFGGITTFFAAIIGIMQNDLKKVIAYSTCSQLGYMLYICGLSNYSLSFFHLFNHAFFKALLFLSAGSIIHAILNEQDIRKMGNLLKILPITYISLLIGSLALMGFPYLTGFYSKDIIIELTFINYSINSMFIYFLANISALFSAYYSIRIIYLIFLIPINNNNKYIIINSHESIFIMYIPLIILFFFSIFIGYFFKDLFIGLGSFYFSNSIFIQEKNIFLLNSEFISSFIKNIPLLFTILGIFLYFILNKFLIIYINKYIFIFYAFFNKKWYLDVIYNFYIINKILKFGLQITLKILDKGFLELLGPEGLSKNIFNYSLYIKKQQISYIYYNFIYIFFGIILFILINIICQEDTANLGTKTMVNMICQFSLIILPIIAFCPLGIIGFTGVPMAAPSAMMQTWLVTQYFYYNGVVIHQIITHISS